MTEQSMKEQELADLSLRISELLERIANEGLGESAEDFSELNQMIDLRKSCLLKLLETDIAQNREWLKRQLEITRGLAKQGQDQLVKQSALLGEYRKGRHQVSVYQNVELGK